MASPGDLDALSSTELKALVIELLGKVAALEQTVAAQRAEIARLKGLKGRPALKPSGMEKASEPKPPSSPKGRRGSVRPRVAVEDQVIKATVPPGSRFKGYADFFVQDLVLRTCCIRYRRERWLTPDGQLIVAPLPGGVDGHCGPELRRFVLAQYHQGQVTLPRLVTQLRALGLAISTRQVMRLLIHGHQRFFDEARDVLRARLAQAAWITVAGTGAGAGRVYHGESPGGPPQGREWDLHADRQRPFRLVRHHGQQKPVELPRALAHRSSGLRDQRRGPGLHAGAGPIRAGHRAAGNPSGAVFPGSGGLAGPS